MHCRGAAYLGGYAIESKLKAVAMEIHDCWTLDDLVRKLNLDDTAVYSHAIEALFRKVPGLNDRFRSSDHWRDFTSKVNRWKPDWRYNPKPLDQAWTGEFLDAVERIYTWLDANRA